MDFYNNKTYQSAVLDVAKGLSVKKCSILVTGATGLIGSCLIDTLLLANRELNCDYTIFALGRNLEKLEKRFSYACNDNHLNFVVQDVCAPLENCGKVDYIIHAASNADPRSYALYPAETLLTNIYGANNVLNFAKKIENVKVLFTSTFETYGKIEDCEAFKEEQYGLIDYNSVRSCYPESKRCAEILFRCYEQEYGVKYSIARLCSIYGPTMDPNDSKAHAQFIRNALNNEDIVLKSEGKPRRTYLTVFDTVSAMFKILFDGKSGEAYNVASDKSVVSIAEVAHTVASICGRKVIFDLPDEIESRGFSAPQNSILDSTKLKELGWEAQYNLQQGMELTIKILKELK